MVEDLTEQADSPQVQQLILLPDILPSCITTSNISNIMDDHAIAILVKDSKYTVPVVFKCQNSALNDNMKYW